MFKEEMIGKKFNEIWKLGKKVMKKGRQNIRHEQT